MRNQLIILSALLMGTACGASHSVSQAYSWDERGKFHIYCELESNLTLVSSSSNTYGGLKTVAERRCGGTYDLIDFNARSVITTGKPSKFESEIKFQCDATTEVLKRARAMTAQKACTGAFKKEHA